MDTTKAKINADVLNLALSSLKQLIIQNKNTLTNTNTTSHVNTKCHHTLGENMY